MKRKLLRKCSSPQEDNVSSESYEIQTIRPNLRTLSEGLDEKCDSFSAPEEHAYPPIAPIYHHDSLLL